MVVYVREKQVSPGRSSALKAYSACSIRGLFRPTECMPCSGRLRTWRGGGRLRTWSRLRQSFTSKSILAAGWSF